MTDAAASPTAPRAADPSLGYGTGVYRGYVLGALLVIYTFNFIDRIVIGLVAEPIKAEFGLSDTMIGLLGGPAFAILYTGLGIPLARLSERVNRVTIITVAVFIWSLMTVLCGVATTFWMLAAFRIGVSIGEAGCTPPANSLIADYFKPGSRPAALSIYAMGVTIGSMCAGLIAALLIDQYSWRVIFYTVGAPGILIAIIAKLTIKEPPRGYTDPPGLSRERSSFGEALKLLKTKASFWHVAAGGTISAFVGYGLSNFVVSFFVRTHEMAISHAIFLAGVGFLFFGALGTYLCGQAIERFAPRNPKLLVWLPAAGFAFAAPLSVLGLTIPNLVFAAIAYAGATFFNYMYLGSLYTVSQAVVDARSRATAVAIMLFIMNLVGYGVGPLFVGGLSDVFANMQLSDLGLTVGACSAEGLAAEQSTQCSNASAVGLQYAAIVAVLLYFWAGLHFYLAGRTLEKDMVAA